MAPTDRISVTRQMTQSVQINRCPAPTSATVPAPEGSVGTVTGVARVALDAGAPVEAHLVSTLAHAALRHPVGHLLAVDQAPQVLEDTVDPQSSHAAHIAITVLHTGPCQ